MDVQGRIYKVEINGVSMKEKILRIAYDKGLYAQGTPDSWDEEALYQFGKHLIEECLVAVETANATEVVRTTYDRDIALSTKAKVILAIQNRFKNENVQ